MPRYTEPLANGTGFLTADDFETPVSGTIAQLFSPTQNAIILPEKYLTTQEGQNGVWKASEGKARFIPVQMGLRADDGVVITSGLQTGDLVLAPEGLQENQRIKPRQGKV